MYSDHVFIHIVQHINAKAFANTDAKVNIFYDVYCYIKALPTGVTCGRLS